MTGTRSGPPTTFNDSFRMTPHQLQEVYESVSEAARIKDNLLASKAHSIFHRKATRNKMRHSIMPYSVLWDAANRLAYTMDVLKEDKPRIYDGEEKWYHNQLHAISELRDRWGATDASQDLVEGIETLEAMTGPVQNIFFQSLKHGENPDKKEYCATAVDRFWHIGKGKTYADLTDDEKEQRKTLLGEAPFRGPGQCGSLATTDLGLGEASVDTRCTCRESVVEEDTTQSAAD